MIYLLALVSIILGSVGQFVLKLASGQLRTGESIEQLLWSFVNIKMTMAIICFVTSMILWVFVLKKMDLSIAYPMVSLGYIFVVLLSSYFLQENLNLPKLLGTGLIVSGVIVLNLK